MKFNARAYPLENALTSSEYAVKVVNEQVIDTLQKEDRRKIDDYWELVTAKFPSLLRKPIMLNLESFDVKNGSITERVKIIDYAMFVSKGLPDLNPSSAGLSKEAQMRIRACSASAIALTSDGFAIFGARPSGVLAPNQITNIPEGMLRVSVPDPFELIATRLENEINIGKGSIKSIEMLGFGQELTYTSVTSSFVMELSLSRAQIEASATKTEHHGAPSRLIFKDAAVGSLNEHLMDGNHPGSSNIAVLNFINHYHGKAVFEQSVKALGIESHVVHTLEAFSKPMGVEVRHLQRT